MNEFKFNYLKDMMLVFPEESGISIAEGKHDRWLGFVQGALWAMDLETINTFRDSVRNGEGFADLKEIFDVLERTRGAL